MGTTSRNLGSATRTKIRTDSSTLSSLVSSDATCCGVTAFRIAFRLNGGVTAGLLEVFVAGLGAAAERACFEPRFIGGCGPRAFFWFFPARRFFLTCSQINFDKACLSQYLLYVV